jgi:hypothetical protein
MAVASKRGGEARATLLVVAFLFQGGLRRFANCGFWHANLL